MMNALIPGSLSAIAKRSGQSLAESFLNVDVLIIVDCSGSMSRHDAPGGRERYEVACEELRRLQADMPGKIGIVAFSNDVQFCPSGHPVASFANTDMAKALRFTKPADDTGIKFILISDGNPDSEYETLAVARTFRTHIDTIYIGPEGDTGQDFLRRLAQATGGRIVKSDKIAMLEKSVKFLLT